MQTLMMRMYFVRIHVKNVVAGVACVTYEVEILVERRCHFVVERPQSAFRVTVDFLKGNFHDLAHDFSGLKKSSHDLNTKKQYPWSQ